ncbi:MAG: type VI secretion system contractile sheath large subunit, partial [Gammaproteobacteria bacterium]
MMTDERTVFGTIAMRFSQSEEGVERSGRPFRIGLFGDFSGLGGVSKPVSERRPVLIDRDNYEDVMARLCPRVRIELGSGAVEVEFREMDDFTPDRLFRDVALFEEFRTLRRRLTNPATFAEAAAGLRPQVPDRDKPPQAQPAVADTAASGGQLLDLILADTDAQGAPPDDGASLADRLVKEIVAPYVIPSPDPEQAPLIAAVDQAASETMAALLHAPQFQAAESAWRQVDLLVRRLETGSSLKLFLLDISKQALWDDLIGNDDLSKSGLYRLLVEGPLETPGGEPWSLLVADYPFSPAPEDAQLAGRLA